MSHDHPQHTIDEATDEVAPDVPRRRRGRPPGKTPPKSSTERVQAYRASKRDNGGSELSIHLNKQATAAIEIIRTHTGARKGNAVERALIEEAKRLAPSPMAARNLMAMGKLSPQAHEAWVQVLSELQDNN